jgi:siderophore-iron reductase FhuF
MGTHRLHHWRRRSGRSIYGPPEDVSASDAFGRFGHIVFDHFDALIEFWSARSDVTRRVLWSNVGNTFEAMLAKVESVSGRSDRLDQARWLLDQPFWKNGRPNPLHRPIYYAKQGDEIVRRRRVCCLQYLLPDRRFCKACPVGGEIRSSSEANGIAWGWTPGGCHSGLARMANLATKTGGETCGRQISSGSRWSFYTAIWAWLSAF